MKFFFYLFFIILFSIPVFTQDKKEDFNKDKFFPYTQDNVGEVISGKVKSFFTKGMQYGGWLTPIYINEDKEKDLNSTLSNTSRIWIKSYLWENSFIYARVKDTLQYSIFTDNNRETDNLFDLDLAYFQMYSSNSMLNFSAGRNYYILGSGLVLNGRGDGAGLNFYSTFVDVKFFGAYTGLFKKDRNPYNFNSRDISDGAKRIFIGGSFAFPFFEQTAYLLGMAQIDMSENDEDFKNQYNSRYIGAGVKGSLPSLGGSLSYIGEFVYEAGKSFTDPDEGDNIEKNISAMAAIVSINYYFNVFIKPVLIVQYAYGSGDNDKNNYRSLTGNIEKGDTGFLSFGTFVGGYAFRPVFANLHIVRGGMAMSPFSSINISMLEKLAIIGKYSFYIKDKIGTAIDDGVATEEKRFAGQGIDLSLRWSIFIDLEFFVNYGVFLSGSAFAESENITFFMCGLNISF